jgi:hypothetical protein
LRRGSCLMVKQPGLGWTSGELQTLRKLARQGTAEAAATALGRTVSAVKLKAMRSGISFRPAQPAAVREQKPVTG